MTSLSKTEEYALRAVIYLARNKSDQPRRATEIADAIDLPANYLSKILHQLARHGLVTSERGPYGGFRLAAPAEETTLAEVIEPFGGVAESQRCLLGRPECSDDNPCGAHEHWKAVKQAIAAFFAETTVADVIGNQRGDDTSRWEPKS